MLERRIHLWLGIVELDIDCISMFRSRQAKPGISPRNPAPDRIPKGDSFHRDVEGGQPWKATMMQGLLEAAIGTTIAKNSVVSPRQTDDTHLLRKGETVCM